MVYRKTFGNASDFYRARSVKLEESKTPQLEWKGDVLYRKEHDDKHKTTTRYKIEVVDLDGGNRYSISTHKKRASASKSLNLIEEDLRELTKIQFENKYNFFEIGK